MAHPRRHASDAERQRAYRQRRRQAVDQQLKARGLPPLPALSNIPGNQRWNTLIQQALWCLQTAHREMETYHDERSESWRDSDRGQSFLDKTQAVDEIAEATELFCHEHGITTELPADT